MHTLAMHQTVLLTKQESRQAAAALRQIDGSSRKNQSDGVEMPLRIEPFVPLVLDVRIGCWPPSDQVPDARPPITTTARAQGAS